MVGTNNEVTPPSLITIRLTAAQAIVRFLSVQFSERDGVRRRLVPGMFGIFGHGNVCGLGQALEEGQHELAFYQPKNEQAMVHAAIGFSKQNDRLATFACTASIGPGATNMLTGAATATVNRIPVLLFPADTFASRLQGPPMQAMDSPDAGDLTVNDAFRPVSRFFDRISRPEQVMAVLPAAMRALVDPASAGAVTVSIHQDTQAEAFDFPVKFFVPRTWYVGRPRPDRAEIDRAAELIASSSCPIIIAGGGVHYSGASEELVRFAERFDIPLAETSAGKGAGLRCRTNTGGVGHSGTSASNALAREADLVICVGTRLIDLTTGSNSLFENPEVRFVSVNLSSGDAHKLGAQPVVGDAREAIAELEAALIVRGHEGNRDWDRRRVGAVAEWSAAVKQDLSRTGTLTQSQVIDTLNSQFQPQDTLVVASGTPHVDVHKLWDTSVGGRIFMEVGFSCMGHEIPAALGARMGSQRPRGEVYALIGDGTYLMGHTELVTAVQEGLKITLVLVVNGGYQSIHALQRGRTGRSFGLEFRQRTPDGLVGPTVDVDYAANARSYGCSVLEARTATELAAALTEARELSGPTVVVVHTDPYHLSIGNGCWWDVGVAAVSQRSETRDAHAKSEQGRVHQRWLG